MANTFKNVKKLNVNGVPYDIKDELLLQVVTDTNIGDTTTTTSVKQEIETAATGTAASANGMTVKEALASLRQKVENKDVGVTNVSATVSTTAGAKKITLKQAKNGGTAAAISNAEIGTATLTIQRNGTNVQTFGANAVADVTANIAVPEHATSPTSPTDQTGFTTPKDVADQITNALADITSFEYSGPYASTSALPSTGEKGVVYLVEDSSGVEGSNEYIEYIWLEDTEISGHYEMLGKHQIAIDDSNYAKLSTNDTLTFTGPNIFKGNGVTVNDGLTLAGYGSGASQHLSALTVGDKALIELNDNGEFDKIASGNTTLLDALDAKQDALTFDNTPTNGSTNPVTSDGVYDAIQTAIGTDDKKPLVIEVDDTDTSVPQGTYASITAAIAAGRDVLLKVTITGGDNQIEYLRLVEDYSYSDYLYRFENNWNRVWLDENDDFGLVYGSANNHTHGNITESGSITTTAPMIEGGDQIVISDYSSSQITNGPTFDGSTTTQALTKKGTWETFKEKTFIDMTVSGTTPSFWDTNNNSLTHAQIVALLQDNTKDVEIRYEDGVYICNFYASDGDYYFSSAQADTKMVRAFSLSNENNNYLAFTYYDDTYLVTSAEKTTWNNKVSDVKVKVGTGTSVSIVDSNKIANVVLDTAPTANSTNTVTSGGVYTAVNAKYTKPSGGIPATDLATAVSQRLLPEGSDSTDDGKILQYSYTGGGWQLISPDITPTSGSNKPITSGAVYTALGDIETLLAAI